MGSETNEKKEIFFKYEQLNNQSKKLLTDQQYTYNHDFLLTLTLAGGCFMVGFKLYNLFKMSDDSITSAISNTINNAR
jgi:hypoxanthine-guanine phosphoribosyltransferase